MCIRRATRAIDWPDAARKTNARVIYDEMRASDGIEKAGPSHDHVKHEPVVRTTLSDGPIAHCLRGGIHNQLIPALTELRDALRAKSEAWKDIIKIGRTHTQDATPITLGQEFSGYTATDYQRIERIEQTMPKLMELAQGGTAVGTD